MEDALERAREAGCSVVRVVAHPRTFAFYEGVGFVVGEAVSTCSGPAVRLRHKLAVAGE